MIEELMKSIDVLKANEDLRSSFDKAIIGDEMTHYQCPANTRHVPTDYHVLLLSLS